MEDNWQWLAGLDFSRFQGAAWMVAGKSGFP
jgi:hypothetical protein